MNENWWELVIPKIDALPIGFEGGIADIFDEDWESMGTSGERRDIGKQFKALVKSGDMSCLEWVGIATSGRHDVYRKIKDMHE